MISSFSGVHDWHPSLLIDTDADDYCADRIIDNIESGRCPRCERALPEMPEFPAGSRITKCRSIPICGPCGSDEFHQALDLMSGVGYGISAASEWPLDVDEIEERRAHYESEMQPAVLTLGDAGDHILTEDGVAPVVNPCDTGGWAQFGGVS
ncbi:MAG: hypothetical protein WBB00_07880 [Mycobacterium sp.]